MTVIDPTNCLILHEFADRYDCPPLKLTAWRMIQEATPAYGEKPSQLLQAASSLVSPGKTGLTGPAETFYRAMQGNIEEDEEELPSIFYPEYNQEPDFPQPDELPSDAPASDVVRAWALRLQDVWNQCNPSQYIDDSISIDWRAELCEIYNVLNMPDKIEIVDKILELYKGKEKSMLQTILQKYHEILPDEYVEHITFLAS